MADELEVLEKQQLSAQRSLNDLPDQLTLADHLVYKKYLTELQHYGMVELSQQILDVQDPAQCIQLFQPVSYTHLDVYKRQRCRHLFPLLSLLLSTL